LERKNEMRQITGPPTRKQIGPSSVDTQRSGWALSLEFIFLAQFRELSCWDRIRLFFKIIYVFIKASIIWLSRKIVRALQFLGISIGMVVLVAIILAVLLVLLLVLFFYSLGPLKIMSRWISNHQLVLLWLAAIAGALLLKKWLPKTIRYKKQLVKTNFIPSLLILGVAIYNLIYFMLSLPQLPSWVWWVASVPVALAILVYFLKKRTGAGFTGFVERYQTDLTVIGLSLFGIVAINLLVHYTTTARPGIWQWYWGNQAFFWAWNAGWVVVAFLTSKRKDGKIIPIASTIRTYVMLALLGGFLVNLSTLWPTGSSVGGIGSSPKRIAATNTFYGGPTSFNDVPPDIAFPIIAKAESGGKQFKEDRNGNVMRDKDGKPIVLRGEDNPHDIGYLQINEVVHAKLLSEHPELDIYGSKEDNLKMGEIIRQKYHGYSPWYLSQSRWGPELAAKGFGEEATGQVSAIVPVEAPVGTFGEEISVQPGFDVRWGESEDSFIVMNDRGLSATYDRANGKFEDLPPPSARLKFQSLSSDKIAIAKLRFRRMS